MMSDNWMTILSEFLVTYWIHSSIFVGVALIAIKRDKIASDTLGECLLKLALLLGIMSSLLQVSGQTSWLKSTQVLTIDWHTQVEKQGNPVNDDGKQNIDASVIQPMEASKHTKISAIGFKDSKQDSAVDDDVSTTQSETGSRVKQYDISLIKAGISWSKIIALLFAAISCLWIFFGVLLLVGKIRQILSLHTILKDRKPVIDKNLVKVFSDLIQENGLKPTLKLSQSSNITSPIALATNEIILPEDFIQQFQYKQIKAAIAHELAHLKRKDCLWLWGGIAIETLFFFQPLNRILTVKINKLVEQRSDELAAEWTGDPQALAEALAVAAQSSFQSNQLEMVLAMTSNNNTLVQRIESLLQQRKSQTKRLLLGIGITIGVSMLILAPGVSINSVQANNLNTVINYQGPADNDNALNYPVNHHTTTGKFEIKTNLNGKLEFNENESDIINFPKNSRFELTSDDGAIEHRLEIVRANDGVSYSYYENGEKKEYKENAKDWFASIIPEMLRSTGLEAEARVARIKKSKGDEGVLDEVELIQSDFIKAAYLKILFEQSQLLGKNITRAIESVTTIDSDFEKFRALNNLFITQKLSQPQHWNKALNATMKIDSDFEQARVLKSLIKQMPQEMNIRQDFFKAVKEISSDFEMKEVLSYYLKHQEKDGKSLISLFDAAKNIQSDFELASLLIEAAKKIGNSNLVFGAYLDASHSIASDFEMRRAFSSLLDYDLQQQHLLKMINIAQNEIGSDGELADLLVAVIDGYSIDSNIKAALIDASKSIASEFERSRIESRLLRKLN